MAERLPDNAETIVQRLHVAEEALQLERAVVYQRYEGTRDDANGAELTRINRYLEFAGFLLNEEGLPYINQIIERQRQRVIDAAVDVQTSPTLLRQAIELGEYAPEEIDG